MDGLELPFLFAWISSDKQELVKFWQILWGENNNSEQVG
jgi:hypothetical protein